MKKVINATIILFCLVVSSYSSKAQNKPTVSNKINNSNNNTNSNQGCMSDEMFLRLKKIHPELFEKEIEINERIYNNTLNTEGNNKLSSQIISIPVVVHVIHNNGPENISDAQIIQGIQDLNDAFNNSGAYYNLNGVATDIQFCLAQRSPFGQPTNGITRTVSTLTNMVAESDDSLLKIFDFWNSSYYLNIWLVNEITSVSLGSGIAGYAYFPSSNGRPEDGIVNEARWFGSSTDNSKVHIHEAGHYLGLYHTFNGGCTNNDCLVDGDHVCDTPPDNSTAPVSCSLTTNTCNTDEDDSSLNNPFRAIALGGLGDQNDMFQNYMDYGLQICQTGFTIGQKNRMVDAINGARNSLLNSNGCKSLCENVYAGLSIPNNNFIVDIPFTINNTSFVFVPASYEWLLDSVVVSTDTTLTLSIHTAGNHLITLRVYNIAAGCFVETYTYINVLCNVTSTFTYTPTIVTPGTTVTFTSTSVNPISLAWKIDGLIFSQSASCNFTFNAGRHSVSLISNGTGCSDTSSTLFFPVGNCVSGSNNNWVTPGGDIINFSSDEPTIIKNSLQQNFGTEGIASISDHNGNFLFNTNGATIFNSKRDTMVNGVGLIGGGSSTQAVMIIPNPTFSNLYYVFTTDDFGGLNIPFDHGGWLAYSIVDMNQDSGRGAVIQKNNLLMTPTCEKLTATYSCDGQSIWVISHEFPTDGFYVYKVSASGVDTVPVISHVGTPVSNSVYSVIGCMKASPKGNKLASGYRDGFTELYDFDNSTGVVSNAVHLQSNNFYGPYGVEFSPNGSKLYVSNVYDGYFFNKIYQYDISSGIGPIINASETLIGVSSSTWRAGSLQAAPNGKIYSIACADYYLDEITNPNAAGLACNFKQKAIRLPNFMNGYGLPNFIAHNDQSYFPKILGPSSVCNLADSIEYSINCGGNSVVWIHKGPNQLLSSTITKAIMRFTLPGIDTLIVSATAPCNNFVADTIIINSNPIIIYLGNDTTICSSGNLILDAGPNIVSYQWQDQSTNRTFKVTAQGTYFATVTGIGGCTSSDTIQVNTFPSTLDIDLGSDIYTCTTAQWMIINAPAGNFASYLWQDGSTKNSILSTSGQQIILQVYDSIGCYASDTLQIFIQDTIETNLGSDAFLCDGNILTLQPAFLIGYDYRWQDGSTSPTYTATHAGKYWVNVSRLGCAYSASDTILISSAGNPILDLGADTLLCPSSSLLLHAGVGQASYLWQDGSSDSIFNAPGAGIYWVIAANANGCYSKDSIEISVCTGLNSNFENGLLNIYPNPTSGIINLQFNPSYNLLNQYKIEVFNALGEQLIVEDLNQVESLKTINLNNLSNGFYTLKINSNKESYFYKLVIKK